MGRVIIDWDGENIPTELWRLPPGRYRLISVNDGTDDDGAPADDVDAADPFRSSTDRVQFLSDALALSAGTWPAEDSSEGESTTDSSPSAEIPR
jgi:hypothetical protein